MRTRAATTYTVTFTAAPGSDSVRALRGTLKLALRRYGLRAIDICEGYTAFVRHACKF